MMQVKSVKWNATTLAGGSATNTSYIVIDTDDKKYSVPLDARNVEYQKVQAWINAGNTVADAD